jgi:hypothetical protein
MDPKVNRECDKKEVRTLERKVYLCKAKLQINQRRRKNTHTVERDRINIGNNQPIPRMVLSHLGQHHSR